MDEQQQTSSNGGDQAALWNGPSGHAWVAEQAVLDDMLRPLEGLLVDTVGKTSALHVLDVGCGTGSTTIALARKLGTQADAPASIFPSRCSPLHGHARSATARPPALFAPTRRTTPSRQQASTASCRAWA